MEWISQSSSVVDIIHSVIPYSGLEGRIIENSIFSRLHRILQSSLAYLTYPSNKVHRFEHSIGVMHLSGTFLFRVVCNSSEENIINFFTEIDSAIKYWLKEAKQVTGLNSRLLSDIKNDIDSFLISKNWIKSLDCDLFRKYIPRNLPDDSFFLYCSVYEAIRLVGLLHDVGHMPYSHITEFALKRLYRDISKEEGAKTEKAETFLKIIKPYCDDNGKDVQIHESIGQKIVDKIFDSIMEDFQDRSDYIRLFVATVFYITRNILLSKPDDNNIFSDLHRIVDGVIDCDRMDYCCRDLYCTGISKELPRYERILSNVQMIYLNLPYGDSMSESNQRKRCYFAYTSKALEQIEMLLQRRWEDFVTINYHHRVHKHELLLELVISQLGREEIENHSIKSTNLKEVNGILPFEISSLWHTIALVAEGGAVDIRFSQLDDEWLNTLLKYKYFERYGGSYGAQDANRNNIIWNRLDELITGRKHYFSLFKRAGGFKRFDIAFHKAYTSSNVSISWGGEYFFNQKLKELMSYIPRVKYYREVNKVLEEWSHKEETKNEYGIIDCILDENDFSLGIKAKDMESIYIISSQSGNPPLPLKEYLIVYKHLEERKALFPCFHIYYLPFFNEDTNTYNEIQQEKLQEKIASLLAKHMQDTIENLKNESHSPSGRL